MSSTLQSSLLGISSSSVTEVFLKKFHGHLTFLHDGHDAPLPPPSFLMGFGFTLWLVFSLGWFVRVDTPATNSRKCFSVVSVWATCGD